MAGLLAVHKRQCIWEPGGEPGKHKTYELQSNAPLSDVCIKERGGGGGASELLDWQLIENYSFGLLQICSSLHTAAQNDFLFYLKGIANTPEKEKWINVKSL